MKNILRYFGVVLVIIGVPAVCYSFAYSYFSGHMDIDTDQFPAFVQTNTQPKVIASKFLFVGDIMIDRSIRKDGENLGYETVFSCLPQMFEGYDEVIGNLEGTVTDFDSVSRDATYLAPASFRFTFDPDAVELLVSKGLSIVSLANNHIKDFGQEGIKQTDEYTKEMGLVTFGDPRTGSIRYAIHDTKGVRVAFVPYNEFFGTPEQTLEDLKTVESISDIQIIYAHWGDEYVHPRQNVKLLARQFVDTGADLVIGSHPHVIQEVEKYKDVEIYYSLGNFIFDQYWEEAVRTGMIVEVIIENGVIQSTSSKLVESKRNAGTCLLESKNPSIQTE